MSSEATFRNQVKQVQDLFREFDPNSPLLTYINSLDKLFEELIKRYREIGIKWKELFVENRTLKESNENYKKIADNLNQNVKLLTRENKRHLQSIEMLAEQNKIMKMEFERSGSWTSFASSSRYSKIKSKVNVWNRPSKAKKSINMSLSKEDEYECRPLDLGSKSLSVISEQEIETPQDRFSIEDNEARRKLWVVQTGVAEENFIPLIPDNSENKKGVVEILPKENPLNILPIGASSQEESDIPKNKDKVNSVKSKSPTYTSKKIPSKTRKHQKKESGVDENPSKRKSEKLNKVTKTSSNKLVNMKKCSSTKEIIDNEKINDNLLPSLSPKERNQPESLGKSYLSPQSEFGSSLRSRSNSIIQCSYSDSIKAQAIANENAQYRLALEKLT